MTTDHQVTFSLTGRTVACRASQTLLEVGEAAGIPMASQCRDGTCGKCRAKLLAGQVDMQRQAGLLPRHRALGYILTCCSRPLTDVVIER